MIYQKILRPLLFRSLDSEHAHNLVLLALAMRSKIPTIWSKEDEGTLGRKVAGIYFPNPLGLAAGMDKNARALRAWRALGFGFVEVGTVTPEPQAGNPKPRMFRLEEDRAIINRMGFNNDGSERMAKRLSKLGKVDFPVGISIGKQITTPIENAADDHRLCLNTLYPYGDYFVMNVSSPNTKDLRKLQGKDYIPALLHSGMEDCARLAKRYELDRPKPLFVKISPDLSEEELEVIIEAVKTTGINGIIATNTTLGRPGLVSSNRKETGGASGPFLHRPSTRIIRKIHSCLPKLPIIGVGGIFNGERARETLAAGAVLIQIYTSLVYRGPEVIDQILKRLEEKKNY